MKVKELIERLSHYPPDNDVLIVDDNQDVLIKAANVEDYTHFQTGEHLGGTIISGSEEE